MTYDDVANAAATLEAEGLTPSGNNVLMHLKQRGLRGSKRTLLHFLKQRPGYTPAPVRAARTPTPRAAVAPVRAPRTPVLPPVLVADDDPVHHAVPTPPPPPPPRPLDPVDVARAHLEQAEQELESAREWMDTACLAFPVSDGLVRNGLSYGGYAREDPARIAVEQTARRAMGEYHEAWQAVVTAQQQLQQLERQHRRGAQEHYIAAHQPELVAELDHWREQLLKAANDWAHAEAKKNVARATQAYEQAVALAPYSSNGHQP